MHPLEDEINHCGHFLLIGDSSEDRFPALSFAAYIHAKRTFTCFDFGGLNESRGKAAGHPVVTRPEDIPDDVGELAIIWTKPRSAKKAVDLAHRAGCTRVWFSFQTGHKDAVAHARDLNMTVVEIGRCPVYYLDDKPGVCAAHTLLTKASGTYRKPPQTDAGQKRREIW